MTNQPKYKIVNGKIVDNKGNEVPLEFGNPEQIKLIKEYENRISELKEGMELEVEFETVHTAQIQFKCFCDRMLFKEATAEDDDDVDCLNNKKIICNNCKTEFILYVQEDNLFVKKN
jgi:hypothetical protein